MGTTRLTIYLVGLVVIVAAAWVFLTQTTLGRAIPAGIALTLILLLVGVGVMASARNINESRRTRRVTQDFAGTPGYAEPRYVVPPPPVYGAVATQPPPVPPPSGDSETIIDERRYD